MIVCSRKLNFFWEFGHNEPAAGSFSDVKLAEELTEKKMSSSQSIMLGLLSHVVLGMHYSPHTTLYAFIEDTKEILDSLKTENVSSIDPAVPAPQPPPTRYRLMDTVTIEQRRINLNGFCIIARSMPQKKTIYRGICEIESHLECRGIHSFLIAVQVVRQHVHAFIFNINTADTMSGTECMLLINHILRQIGANTCTLQNISKYRYDRISLRYIPLISLRCIHGRTSDWYSNFGYFNQNHAAISREMKRVHESPYHNTTLGEYLLNLWNRENKTAFHHAYQQNTDAFSTLISLRDPSWIKAFSGISEGDVINDKLFSDTAWFAVMYKRLNHE